MFQSFNLLATLSAYENVELPLTILGKLSPEEIEQRTKELLESILVLSIRFSFAVVGLEDRLNHLPSELSGGEQQRVYVDLFCSFLIH